MVSHVYEVFIFELNLRAENMYLVIFTPLIQTFFLEGFDGRG